MSDTLNTKAFAKIILHAVKYPHCAVNGLLLADGTTMKDGAKNQNLRIVDAVPLFHHSHYVSPMAEVALTQVDTMAQSENFVIAGYYAGCENFDDNTIDKCPGQKIAEKIAENFPAAIFVVVDNKRMTRPLVSAPINVYKWIDGKWKLKDNAHVFIEDPTSLSLVSQMIDDLDGIHRELIDFDNYLDDVTKDWSNSVVDQELLRLKKGSVKSKEDLKTPSDAETAFFRR